MGSKECFSDLVGPASGSERRTKCSLQAVHGGFSKGSPVITFDALPGPAAKQATLPDSTIPLGPAGFAVEDRPFSWRGNETRAPSSCGFIAHLAIIGSVANDLCALSGIGNPEHLSKHLGVMFLAWGHDSAHDTGGLRVYPEMDLAVGAPLVAMDGGEPGVGPTDLQARGIDHDAGSRLGPCRQRHVSAPSGQGRRIGDGQDHAHKGHNRAHEADRLAQGQPVHLLEYEPQKDHGFRVHQRAAPLTDRGSGIPLGA